MYKASDLLQTREVIESRMSEKNEHSRYREGTEVGVIGTYDKDERRGR